MNRAPAFQFYPADWLSSPKVTTMTPGEEGAYIRLLCYAWADPDCTIPDDDEVLAKLSRLGEAGFNGGSTSLRKCFEAHPKKSGRLFNARLLEERKKQEAWRKKSQEGGKRSAESRASRCKHQPEVSEGWLNGGSRVVESNGNSPSSSSLKEINREEIQSAPIANAYSVKKSKQKKSPLAVPLPGKFTITDDLWDWTVNKGYPRQFVERQFEHFCNDARAKAKRFADWEAAFRNWLLKAEEFAVARNGHYPQRTDGDPAQNQERIPL